MTWNKPLLKMPLGHLRRVLLSLSSGLLVVFLCGSTFAAPADFPKKEITVIVNFAPGGARDILARGVGNTMSKYLGVPVVVMNQAGAGGARGLTNLYHSAPDGYTIGVGTAVDVIDQIMEKRDYDNKKFSYVARVQHSPTFFFVRSDSPFRSVKDFKTYGKPIRQSTFSLTSATIVASCVLARREAFPLVIVGGYQGAAAAILGLVRGEVELFGSVLSSVMPFVQAGQIRPILTLSQERWRDFPDIPTAGELGYPDLEGLGMDFWLMAPPGVPKDRIQILEDALTKTLKDPEFLRWAKGADVDVDPLSGQETSRLVSKLFVLLEQYKEDLGKYIKK